MKSKAVKYILLSVFIFYFGSISLFKHTHQINGTYYVHSHPFNTDANGLPLKHQHTKSELFVLEILSSLLLIGTAILSLHIIYRKLTAFVLSQNSTFQLNAFHLFKLLRAPPISEK